MRAAHKDSILTLLDLDAALVESLPEAVWSELIGFIEYDSQLLRESSDNPDGRDACEAACRKASDWPPR